ncbi:hypothetical protein ACQQCD_05770 [Pseudarthrobacter sp. J1763]|uniref:hypothetical protein n=1 Tax=Pseudarthrobacter sp. J1763 TaxID=3420445 RepID=UPI003D2C3A42
MAGTFAMYAILPAIFIGAPLGLVAGLLMRPVRNQWWHVLALGAAGFVTGCLTMVLMGGDLGTGAWPYGLGTAAASALGRFAVWRRVTVHPDPQYPAASGTAEENHNDGGTGASGSGPSTPGQES